MKLINDDSEDPITDTHALQLYIVEQYMERELTCVPLNLDGVGSTLATACLASNFTNRCHHWTQWGNYYCGNHPQ